MVIFQMSLNPKREELFKKLTEIPEAGRKSKSELVEWALEEFLLRHGKSQNPQTKIPQFDKEEILAVPNIYQNRQVWENFYNLMKKIRPEEYKILDEQLNLVLSIHNQKL